jgi:protein TonB
MDNKENIFEQSMDDIVFDNRNKGYGAYKLRETYAKHMMKALAIAVGFFIFSLYTPKMGKALGLFKEKEPEKQDTTSVELTEPPSLKPDEPLPPPPPPEVKLELPTQRFMEIVAAKKEDVTETLKAVEEIKEAAKEDVKGKEPENPVVITEVIQTPVVDDKIYEEVDQKAYFIGGQTALEEFIGENLVYPEAERVNEITGQTLVSFVVELDGKVVDVKVARTSGNARLDAEAVKVIKKCNHRFKPGRKNGKDVRSYCRIPINFDLEDE